jgi:hypothetical protein
MTTCTMIEDSYIALTQAVIAAWRASAAARTNASIATADSIGNDDGDGVGVGDAISSVSSGSVHSEWLIGPCLGSVAVHDPSLRWIKKLAAAGLFQTQTGFGAVSYHPYADITKDGTFNPESSINRTIAIAALVAPLPLVATEMGTAQVWVGGSAGD